MKSGYFDRTGCPTAASTSKLPSSLQEPVQFPQRWNQFLGWKAQTNRSAAGPGSQFSLLGVSSGLRRKELAHKQVPVPTEVRTETHRVNLKNIKPATEC